MGNKSYLKVVSHSVFIGEPLNMIVPRTRRERFFNIVILSESISLSLVSANSTDER